MQERPCALIVPNRREKNFRKRFDGRLEILKDVVAMNEKNVALNLMVSPDLKDRIEKKAKACDLTVSQLVRRHLSGVLSRKAPRKGKEAS